MAAYQYQRNISMVSDRFSTVHPSDSSTCTSLLDLMENSKTFEIMFPTNPEISDIELN